MTIRLLAAATVFVLTYTMPAQARIHRSHTATHAFERSHPCPSTGKPKGACPGWIIDHIWALCDGGPDVPANMEWQTVENAKIKDRTECRTPTAKARRRRHDAVD